MPLPDKRDSFNRSWYPHNSFIIIAVWCHHAFIFIVERL
jgi:hypothetical protein